jgi:hypothetical protein
MSNFGSEPGESGFNAISREYKSSPTIENYVRLRRLQPDGEIEIATTGGIEFLFSHENELRSHGLDPLLIVGLSDADTEAQAEVSLRLLEMLIERDKLQKSGATHVVSRKKAINDGLINYLIATSLDGMSWNDELTISRELIVLIKRQLGTLNSQYEAELEKHTRKSDATWIAAQLLAAGKTPTYRNIGRIFGVQATSVMRWFADGDFMAEAKKLVPLVRDLLPSVKKFAEDRKIARDLTEDR